MASFSKQKNGWRVQLSIKGMRDSKVFSTKAEGQAWAIERASELQRQADTGINTDKTCQDAFDRYIKEVSVHKRGHRWEAIRLTAIAGHWIGTTQVGTMLLCNITPDALGKWRDTRLLSVTGSTVNREMNLLSHVFTTARREWKWIAESPTGDVRRPKSAAHRDRRLSEDEIDRICLALGFDGETVNCKLHAVAVAFLFAIETAMRAGEICALTWGDITGSVANLRMTKNGSKRQVPLSSRAVELLGMLPRDQWDTCFGVKSDSLSTLFATARKRADIHDMTFHDTRHEAITRLAKKLDVLELARMVGHKDLKMLQIYYNETAAELGRIHKTLVITRFLS
jgi:integrase